MILSFSEPAMLPYIRAGIRQALGEDVGGARVKRQTIRRRGPRADALLAWDPLCHTHPYPLHLWWKSRTSERDLLGTIPAGSRGLRIYPIDILHSRVEYPDGRTYPVLRIAGPRGWRGWRDAMIFWSAEDGGDDFIREAYADGFDSVEAFRDYFVPNMGDRFDGVIFRW